MGGLVQSKDRHAEDERLRKAGSAEREPIVLDVSLC